MHHQIYLGQKVRSEHIFKNLKIMMYFYYYRKVPHQNHLRDVMKIGPC